jgi:lysine 2,3-aminomutase
MATNDNTSKEKQKYQLRTLLKTPADISNYLKIELPEEIVKVAEHYPILTSTYYLDLIDKNNIDTDPIWKQVIPSPDELENSELDSEDPLHEEPQMPVDRLIHRYKDRAVLVSTNRCTMQCRFCFRKRYWKSNSTRNDISEAELEAVCKYLKETPSIREILLSGGDPLIFNDSKLKYILDKLYAVKNIDIVRIATRVPVTLPKRITNNLSNLLSQYPGLWIVTHFNHPKEVNKNSLEACNKIIKSGTPILNQTVLLKGVNDSADTLEELFRSLVKNKIKPHYLFHVDPVKSVTHFSTGIQKGLDILKEFRSTLSSIAVPHFAIDLPEGGGKVSLQPNYKVENKYLGIDNKKLISYPQ